MGWITALKAPAIAALARGTGPLQVSLSGTHNFASPPTGPAPREDLLTATGNDLANINASVGAGRLNDQDQTGIRVGKVINKRKVGKHFITSIRDGRFTSAGTSIRSPTRPPRAALHLPMGIPPTWGALPFLPAASRRTM